MVKIKSDEFGGERSEKNYRNECGAQSKKHCNTQEILKRVRQAFH